MVFHRVVPVIVARNMATWRALAARKRLFIIYRQLPRAKLRIVPDVLGIIAAVRVMAEYANAALDLVHVNIVQIKIAIPEIRERRRILLRRNGVLVAHEAEGVLAGVIRHIQC